MSAEQLSEFFEAVLADPGLIDQLKFAKRLDAATRIAMKAGFNVTKEDWLEVKAREHLGYVEEMVLTGPKSKYNPDEPLRIWLGWLCTEKRDNVNWMDDQTIELSDTHRRFNVSPDLRPPIRLKYNIDLT